jgi:hypothetical protein
VKAPCCSSFFSPILGKCSRPQFPRYRFFELGSSQENNTTPQSLRTGDAAVFDHLSVAGFRATRLVSEISAPLHPQNIHCFRFAVEAAVQGVDCHEASHINLSSCPDTQEADGPGMWQMDCEVEESHFGVVNGVRLTSLTKRGFFCCRRRARLKKSRPVSPFTYGTPKSNQI